MVGKCANSRCLTVRRDEGKLFRLDINLGSKSGGKNERKTEYIWLCGQCAQVMHPKVEVIGDTVTLRLTKNEPMLVSDNSACMDGNASWRRAN
jgi:hypothetical protein